jgi:multiple sugar transport system substrate-binding protein
MPTPACGPRMCPESPAQGPVRFRGITWDHDRGVRPLRSLAAAAERSGLLSVEHSVVCWDTQGLAGFESRPIQELAERYDLLVVDHPGLGDAVAAAALAPLDELFTQPELERWAAQSVGASMASYHYLGHQWAVPIDAAAQVSAVRDDQRDQLDVATWPAVVELAADVPATLPLAKPHALLTFLGICAAFDPGFEPDDRCLAPRDVMEEALRTMIDIVRAMPPAHRSLGPIELLERMAAGTGATPILWTPLVFGYVPYARAASDAAHRVRFRDAPTAAAGGVPGSVLGGTGLAVSRPVRDERVLDHIRQALHPQAQRHVIPSAGGQPSATAAWDDDAVNSDALDFYRRTRRTQERAWRRPRHPGWIGFQTAASDLLLDGIARGARASPLLDALDECYRRHRPAGARN